MLALGTLNGLSMQGQLIKVTLFTSLIPIPLTLQLQVMSKTFAACIFNMFAFVCIFIFKVQRPVHESMLDVDLTLEALMCDSLNSSNLYAVKLNPRVAQRVHFPAHINGHTFGTGSIAVDRFPPAKVNGTRHTTEKFKLSEEMVRETFSHFGTVDGVALHPKPGKYARHAHISEFRRLFLFFYP